ncbi:MAG: hypothetical protein ACLGIK_16215, partial [Gemmatimonadota bacterium]
TSRGPGLALDPLGRPHIAHGAGEGGQWGKRVTYSFHDGITWHHEYFGEVGSIGFGIALDANDSPHIAYAGGGILAELTYVTKGLSGEWTHERFGLTGVWAGAIWLDAQENPHVVVRSGGALVHAWRAPEGVWSTEVVDPNANRGHDIDLELDAQGLPHVVYFVPSVTAYSAAGYARMLPDGSWETIVADDVCDFDLGLGLDSKGYPHIACHRYGLKYIHYDGTNWTSEMVRSNNPYAWELDVEVDSQDRPHIAYGNIYSGGDRIDRTLGAGLLYHAVKTEAGWQVETVDHMGEYTGLVPDLELDDSDRPRIAYVLGWWRFENEGPTNRQFNLMYAEPVAATVLNPMGL